MRVPVVTIPDTLSCLENNVVPVTVVIPAKVDVPETFRDPSVPTEVSDELTTPEPSVVASRTVVLLIL